jgi:lysozyme
MRISSSGRAITRAFEGCHRAVPGMPGHFRAYICPAGVLTIGVGHTNHHEPKFKADDVWSAEKCDAVQASDMAIFEKHVDNLARGVSLTQAQYDALGDWSFNTGGPANSAVWTYVRKGDIDGVCVRLSRWVNGGGKQLPGLVRRRKANCAQYRNNVQEAMRIAGAKPVDEHEPARGDMEKPQPSGGEIAKRSKAQAGTVAAGGGGATGTTVAQDQPDYALIAFFAVVAVIGLVLLVRRIKFIKEDWA